MSVTRRNSVTGQTCIENVSFCRDFLMADAASVWELVDGRGSVASFGWANRPDRLTPCCPELFQRMRFRPLPSDEIGHGCRI